MLCKSMVPQLAEVEMLQIEGEMRGDGGKRVFNVSTKHH